MRAFVASLLFVVALPGVALADDKPLDVREPPFAFGDFAWLDGFNGQPDSLLKIGPVTASVYVDTYWLYQFQHPIDHVAFPATSGSRHNELSINLASIGLDVTGLDGPVGRVILQYGSNVETVAGQDATTTRGFFLSNRVFQYLQQATVGWHFHAMHGVQVEVGVMPSLIGIESYLTQENWNYSRAMMLESVPYYMLAARADFYPTDRLLLQAYATNGWQTYGKWGEATAFGYLLNYRPSDRFVVTTNGYVGADERTTTDAVRIYTNHYAQWQFLRRKTGALRSGAIAAAVDVGGETVTGGLMLGGLVATRLEWDHGFATTFRMDTYYDKNQTLIARLPSGSPYDLPDHSPFYSLGLTGTLEYTPSPWIVFRAEYMHRAARIPYFAGTGGITGPGGIPTADPSTFAPDLRKSDDRVIVAATLRL